MAFPMMWRRDCCIRVSSCSCCAWYFSLTKNCSVWSQCHRQQRAKSMVPLLSAMRMEATRQSCRAIFWTLWRSVAVWSHWFTGRAKDSVCAGYVCCTCSVCASCVRLPMACARERCPEHGRGQWRAVTCRHVVCRPGGSRSGPLRQKMSLTPPHRPRKLSGTIDNYSRLFQNFNLITTWPLPAYLITTNGPHSHAT